MQVPIGAQRWAYHPHVRIRRLRCSHASSRAKHAVVQVEGCASCAVHVRRSLHRRIRRYVRLMDQQNDRDVLPAIEPRNHPHDLFAALQKHILPQHEADLAIAHVSELIVVQLTDIFLI